MNILKSLIQIKSKILARNNLEEIFDFLLTQIESSKGNLQLINIFELISAELQKNKINSIVCIINDKRDEVIVRHVSFPGEFRKIFTTENIKATGFKKFSKYQETIKTKKAIYNENRLSQFKKIIPQIAKYFKEGEEMNSIIAPLILRGELIGTLEILSLDLERDDLQVVESFVKKLVISITNNILFHEIGESEKRYRDLFENSSDGLAFFNIGEKRFRESNLVMRKLSGYTVDELKQLHFLRLFDRDDRQKVDEIITSIRDKKNSSILPMSFCVKIRTKNKEIKIVNIEIGPQVDENEICFNFHDVTERKLAEEENTRLKEFNQKIVDSSPVSILVLDKQGKIILANDMAKELMKKTKHDLLGRDLLEIKEIKKNRTLQKQYGLLLKSGNSFHYDNLSYISEFDGKIKFLNIIAVALFDKRKKVNGAISMAIDNTEKVLDKQNLEELNKNLESTVAQRTKELDEINKELNKVLDLKLKFISDASHELRTPLTIIQGNLDLEIQEYLHKQENVPEAYLLIEKEIEQMTGILADLTMLTNADASSEIISCDDIDLHLLAKTVVQSLLVLASKKNIDMKVIDDKKNVVINGDETKIEKLLLNIVRNAIKYTEEGGKIKVIIQSANGLAEIIVKDTGIGIPSEDLPYIFERFYRVDKARSRKEGGTGLGLSICKWIAEAHNGKIRVKSQLGVGSEFIVSFPCKCQGDAGSNKIVEKNRKL